MASDQQGADPDRSGYSVMFPGHPAPDADDPARDRPGEESTPSESVRLPAVSPLFHVDNGE